MRFSSFSCFYSCLSQGRVRLCRVGLSAAVTPISYGLIFSHYDTQLVIYHIYPLQETRSHSSRNTNSSPCLVRLCRVELSAAVTPFSYGLIFSHYDTQLVIY